MRSGKTIKYLVLVLVAFAALFNNGGAAANRRAHTTTDYRQIAVQIDNEDLANAIKLNVPTTSAQQRISLKIKKYRRRFILSANNKFTPANVCVILKNTRPGTSNEAIKEFDYLAIKCLLSSSLELKNCAILI